MRSPWDVFASARSSSASSVRTSAETSSPAMRSKLPESWVSKRGKIYGCGMAVLPLGAGVVGIPAIVKALKKLGFKGTTTLEIAGAENVKLSAQRLNAWAKA